MGTSRSSMIDCARHRRVPCEFDLAVVTSYTLWAVGRYGVKTAPQGT